MQGQFYVDASDWKKWYYIDMEEVRDSLANDSTYDAAHAIRVYDIPMDATGEVTEQNGHQLPGQYMYWFDCWGEGLKNNRFSSFTPTAQQPEPEKWTIAIHRDNVRTNPETVIGVYESPLADINAVTATVYENATWTADEWTENAVWCDQSQMLLCYVPSQGIRINKLLSSWLELSIPPFPPSFTHNNHVFVLALRNGRHMALQLVDYISPRGVKCCMTVKYKDLP